MVTLYLEQILHSMPLISRYKRLTLYRRKIHASWQAVQGLAIAGKDQQLAVVSMPICL